MSILKTPQLIQGTITSMIEAELSRRVGRLMHTQIIEAQSLEERFAFIAAMEKARSLENLSSEYKNLIKVAEVQLSERLKLRK